METEIEKRTKQGSRFSQSITVKAIIIAALTLIMLIPGIMIQELISERQYRSEETIRKINSKWSSSQTLFGPLLVVPYTEAVMDEKNNVKSYKAHELFITPEELSIETKLFPEERHYGIYKTILYRSEISISGCFDYINTKTADLQSINWDKAYLSIVFSDLKGITNNLVVNFNGRQYTASVGENNSLTFAINDKEAFTNSKKLSFNYDMNLNGSSSIEYIPVGRTTKVHVSGVWNSPSYIGEFSPEITPSETGFDAKWSILSFNRNIPETWNDSHNISYSNSFGVLLVDTVDHYQQNMRSAKYASLFIILTFVVFFFVEILNKKRIHPIQYLLVGAALMLFYTLLLSISEQLGFLMAYLIASLSTIGLITFYSYTILKNKTETGILASTLSVLYLFLYTILQLEDVALLIGSIGLFIILAIVMYISRKISWYKQE